MKTTILAAAVIFATSAFAAPGTAARWSNHASRRAQRKSGFMQPAKDNDILAKVNETDKDVIYSDNWAGAILNSSGFTSVVGTIIVPEPQSTGEDASASAWVGIDGLTCSTAILQTGIDFSVTSGGSVSYTAWYEWYPDDSYEFSEFSVSAGDEVKMTVVATSKAAGTATLENLTTGQTASHSFRNERNQLCESEAEWIVEDYEYHGALVTFANFDSVTFTDATAFKGDSAVDLADATILNIEQDNAVLTDCSTDSVSTVTCSYV
ncbi:peptidase A4 family-domain-containing protein [Xylaria bambusicola]|uniref:peptidase A4 family-domain-containing protein n=1 Tax=Xylaria bambusicola TaxID=326684 RepID=UPI00200723DE|nr:peptidase A4 family-domain-containing protein [Xylaria bambusicola]KAI0521472.1 peptidase A4 family-domain-containing protein [Xylaria bambusicola]